MTPRGLLRAMPWASCSPQPWRHTWRPSHMPQLESVKLHLWCPVVRVTSQWACSVILWSQ